MRRQQVLAFIGALLALIALGPPVRAAGEVATQLSVRPIEPVTVGVAVEVTVDLTTADGTPLANEAVTFAGDGAEVRRTRTDGTGVATFRIGAGLPPGEYGLLVTYAGRTGAYLGASASATLAVIPFDLAIETVPPLPGMVFEFDGTRFVAGDDGVVHIPVDVAGDHELAVIEDSYSNPDQRAEFSRWNTELFGPRITLRIPYDQSLQAGFDVSFNASQIFLDLEGGEVDPSRVTSLTLRSSIGTVQTYPDGQARWYRASRVVRRVSGLESVAVRYNVDSVEVDGSNVVNSGQQRFLVQPRDTWNIELLLFSARLAARDALFGFSIGQAVDVEYPNGTVVRVEPDETGELWARWLARGIYRMTVADAPGWAPVMPVALSRDQDVQLKVISYLDMVVAAIAGLGLALGLLHLGRPHLVPDIVAGAGRGVARIVPLPERIKSRSARWAYARARPETTPVRGSHAATSIGDPIRRVQNVPLPPAIGAGSLPATSTLVPRTRSAAQILLTFWTNLDGAGQLPGDSLARLGGSEPRITERAVIRGARAGAALANAPATENESCPTCGHLHVTEAGFCRRCGQVLRDLATPRPLSSASHRPSRRKSHRPSRRKKRQRWTRGKT